ncbi:hypothetical protein SAMN02982985_04738 [Rugamonas rubra]|uniref:Uncharacterized protein n=1 Tax=Rugamonas rubra TaxID=758825 RepID=A0A1I4SF24_9BURK|nr:hypothetical protein SAMN02982985_04738 [Rugamonas rubra]
MEGRFDGLAPISTNASILGVLCRGRLIDNFWSAAHIDAGAASTPSRRALSVGGASPIPTDLRQLATSAARPSRRSEGLLHRPNCALPGLVRREGRQAATSHFGRKRIRGTGAVGGQSHSGVEAGDSPGAVRVRRSNCGKSRGDGPKLVSGRGCSLRLARSSACIHIDIDGGAGATIFYRYAKKTPVPYCNSRQQLLPPSKSLAPTWR